MTKGMLMAMLAVYLLISFVPMLALPNLMGKTGKGKK